MATFSGQQVGWKLLSQSVSQVYNVPLFEHLACMYNVSDSSVAWHTWMSRTAFDRLKTFPAISGLPYRLQVFMGQVANQYKTENHLCLHVQVYNRLTILSVQQLSATWWHASVNADGDDMTPWNQCQSKHSWLFFAFLICLRTPICTVTIYP